MEIYRGAEAVLSLEDGKIIKERVSKSYRIKEIDNKIRKICTRNEAKLLDKASLLINTPKVFDVNEENKSLVLEYINGKRVRDVLESFSKKERENICKEIGRNAAILHNNSIIHGDLTTSNFLFTDKVYFIDFGLGFFSNKAEDKAVDLHLLKQALNSKHFNIVEESFNAVLEGYKEKSNDFNRIMERLDRVESRGRYKRKGF